MDSTVEWELFGKDKYFFLSQHFSRLVPLEAMAIFQDAKNMCPIGLCHFYVLGTLSSYIVQKPRPVPVI
jgi:hypothetical protein